MKTTNRNYEKLNNLGTVNARNKVTVYATDENLGISVSTDGAKKATKLEVLIPTRRSGKGSRRSTYIELNGAQARELYETLQKFYDQRPE